MIVQGLAIIFVFFTLVMVHEFGHFSAAKLVGVRVEKFSIGFSPTLFSFKYGETEYAIGMIPLGGFVKMSGMIDESMDAKIEGEPYEFNSQSAWAKTFILSAGVIMNIILGVLIFFSIYFFSGKEVHDPFVGRVSPKSFASEVGIQPNDRIIAINDLTVDSFEDFLSGFITNLGDGGSITVIRSGKKVALNVQKDIFQKYPPTSVGFSLRQSTVIAYVDTTMPAGKLGLKAGDVITGVDGSTIKYWYQLDPMIRPRPGKTIQLSWDRNGIAYRDSIKIAKIEYEDQEGFLQNYGQIGVGFMRNKGRMIEMGFLDAFSDGIDESFSFLKQNALGLYMMISGKTKAQDSVGGILTIAAVTGAVAETGFINLLQLLAHLSLILAFFNILPVPLLDGGHILIVLIEAIRRKPLSINVRLNIQKAGMILILLLVIAVFYIDIMRFFG